MEIGQLVHVQCCLPRENQLGLEDLSLPLPRACFLSLKSMGMPRSDAQTEFCVTIYDSAWEQPLAKIWPLPALGVSAFPNNENRNSRISPVDFKEFLGQFLYWAWGSEQIPFAFFFFFWSLFATYRSLLALWKSDWVQLDRAVWGPGLNLVLEIKAVTAF